MRWPLLSLSLSLLLGTTRAQTAEPNPELPQAFQEFCFDCHGEGSKKGNVSLDQLNASTPEERRKLWFSVWRNLDAELMPPRGKPRPSSTQRTALQAWIESSALGLDPKQPDPGSVTIRRLNREEYRYTIHDLTGVDYPVQERFPPDDTGYGFDTIGDVLNLSPIHLEKYIEAAKEIVSSALSSSNPMRAQLVPEGPPPSDPRERTAYAKEIIRVFARKALRRPVDKAFLERLCGLAEKAGDFDTGLRQAFSAILASPRFLFRAELQAPEPSPAGTVPLDEFALASRLSYFLWNSLPDNELYTLAEKGQLRTLLAQQVSRMLADPKTERFSQNFVGQWLQTRDAEAVPIQAKVILGVQKSEQAEKIFPFKLRNAMRKETQMLFLHILQKGLPAEELITAHYSFLSGPLAAFYGIPNVSGSQFRMVTLPAEIHRRGILGHGSFLLLTSNPTRTSPVKRGQFLLENILGTPAPPPPPNIPPLEEKSNGKTLGMREMMELHRSDALCASCHARMDPLGLALEQFNALGQYRPTVDNKTPDVSGQLITGEKFQTLDELIQILATSRRHDYYRCLSEKMLIYALGRGLEPEDIPHLKHLMQTLETQNGSMISLVQAIVNSTPFQYSRQRQKNVALTPASPHTQGSLTP
jgi:hypothetical protein